MTLAELYPFIRTAHVSLALTSGALFLCRGVGMLLGVATSLDRLARRVSHLLDTALLLTALLLLVILRIEPSRTPWLLAKLSLIVLYILFGLLTLDRGRTRTVQALAFVAALTCYGSVILTARARQPLGLMSLLFR